MAIIVENMSMRRPANDSKCVMCSAKLVIKYMYFYHSPFNCYYYVNCRNYIIVFLAKTCMHMACWICPTIYVHCIVLYNHTVPLYYYSINWSCTQRLAIAHLQWDHLGPVHSCML